MTAPRLQNTIFVGLILVLFLLVGRVFAPFFSVILWSLLLYILLGPLYHRMLGKLDATNRHHKAKQYFLAGAFSIGSVILILIPIGFIVFQLIKQFIELAQFLMAMFNSNSQGINQFIETICVTVSEATAGAISLTPAELTTGLNNALAQSMNRIIQASTTLAKDIGGFVLQFAFMIFTLYFFYLDGHYLAKLVTSAVPIRGEYVKELFGKFKDITKNLFSGYILVALFQGIMAWIIFMIFSIKSPLAFAVLTMISSFIPMLGAALVWLPIGILKVVSGEIVSGILFMLTAGVFVSLLDNLVRPFFLKDRIHLHPLIIFFAILGGVQVFGINGLILGPMVVLLFLTALNLYLSEHNGAGERTQPEIVSEEP